MHTNGTWLLLLSLLSSLLKMNNAFRSHLMQQFMASARNQARSPPVAVCGWLGADGDRDSASSSSDENTAATMSPHAQARLNQRHRHHFVAYPYTTPMLQSADKRSLFYDPTIDLVSEIDSYDTNTTTTADATNDDATAPNATAAALQSLLRTRRTSSKYQHPPLHSAAYYTAALDRAVAAGRTAPNHKRTEAVSFRRIASPETIRKLAAIAAKVSDNPAKGEKWQRTPAFLVTLVHHQTVQAAAGNALSSAPAADDDDDDDHSNNILPITEDDAWYKPLAFVPPQSTLELEDYAAACAATQNVLLSLHSEGLATKWATGPVIQTPAFRSLIDANATDRIVALIFIGESASPTVLKRTYRRNFHGDFLRDV
jgi:nitroreductase